VWDSAAGRRSLPVALLAAVVTVIVGVAIGWFVLDSRPTDVVMTLLLGVVLTALRFGYATSIATTVLSVLAYDYFFTEPIFRLEVYDRRDLLTFAVMLFVALVISNQTERLRRSMAATRAREIEIENERLRNALLSSVSHDLRTPLGVVKGAATALLEQEDTLPQERRREYLQAISDEASRINRFVRNLLDVTSLEAGALRARKEWQPLEEVIGVALNRMEEPLGARPVQVRIDPDAALAPFDATLIEHVLVNLVENATKYTPRESRLEINARRVESGVEIEVADGGPGIPVGQEEQVFAKFHRATPAAAGMGLGLTICRGIVTAHGGRIWCENRPAGGASFRFVLPWGDGAPKMNVLPEVPEGA
jgi:two-component system sensor histidine kinase KdpD